MVQKFCKATTVAGKRYVDSEHYDALLVDRNRWRDAKIDQGIELEKVKSKLRNAHEALDEIAAIAHRVEARDHD